MVETRNIECLQGKMRMLRHGRIASNGKSVFPIRLFQCHDTLKIFRFDLQETKSLKISEENQFPA